MPLIKFTLENCFASLADRHGAQILVCAENRGGFLDEQTSYFLPFCFNSELFCTIKMLYDMTGTYVPKWNWHAAS